MVEKKDEKKFKCEHPGCTKAFNRRDYLLRHAANHLEVLPFECPQCPQRFARADLLEKHLNTKSHEKRRKREEKKQLMKERAQLRQNRQRAKSKSSKSKSDLTPSTSVSSSMSDMYHQHQQQQQQQAPFVQPNTTNVDYQAYSSQYPTTSTTTTNNASAPYYNNGQQEQQQEQSAVYNTAGLVQGVQGINRQYYNGSSSTSTGPDDFSNVASSNLDFNVSGNYAWLFGKEFWSDVYPKGASYAYDLLTDTNNFMLNPNAATSQQQRAVAAAVAQQQQLQGQLVPQQQHQRNQTPQVDIQVQQPPLPQSVHRHSVPQTRHQYPVTPHTGTPPHQPQRLPQQQYHQQNHSQHTQHDSQQIKSEATPQEEKVDTPKSTSSKPERKFPAPDYLGTRIGVNASLLSKFVDQNTQKSMANGEEPVMNRASTVYTKDPKEKNGAIKEHVFGRTYGDGPSNIKPKALLKDHVYVDASTQAKILNVIDSSSRSTMEEAKSILNEGNFSSEMLSWYLELYWSNFDPMYPMIHKPKFKARNAEPELLICMAIVGMAYAHDGVSYNLAIKLHRKIRIVILGMIGDESSQVPIWVLQCLLLLNYFVQVFGSQRMVEVSQVFNGSHIALLRMSGYLSDLEIPKIPENYATLDVDEFWDRYIIFETKKRTAFFAFICDTQQAVFYRHTLGLSAFEVGLEMPCSDACWEAPTSDTFIEIYRVQPRHLQPRPPPDLDELVSYPGEYDNEKSKEEEKKNEQEMIMKDIPIPTQGNWPTFLFSVRRLMSPYEESQREYPLECFSPYSRFVLLHGLLSISWEMQWRGILDMGIVSKRRMNEFKTRLVVAFTSWKGYFDRQLRKLNTPELNRIVTNSASSTASSPRVDDHTVTAATAFPHQLTAQNIELNNYSNTLMLCSNWALYHFGLIVLYEDALMIRKYAELPRYVSDPSQFTIVDLQARKYVLDWVNTHDAKWATWHAMHFLQRIFVNELLIHQADSLPWCTIIAALTLWAYDRDNNKDSSRNLISSSQYCPNLSSLSSSRYGALEIDKDAARRDAMIYLDLIKQSPPRSLSDSPQHDDNEDSTSDPLKRTEYVISVVAYTYALLQRFDRSGANFLQILHKILVQYP